MAKGIYINNFNFNISKKVKAQIYYYKGLIAVLPELEIAWSKKNDKKLPFKFILSIEWLAFGFWIRINKN